jgi:hypothetical protein
MSEKGNKEKKAQPIIKESPEDISISSPSGSPCICKDKREIACSLHGG